MNDKVHYDQVAKELQAKELVPGVWAKAFAKAGGELERARAVYIKYRVAQLAQAASDKLQEEKRRAKNAAKQREASKFPPIGYAFMSVLCGLFAVLFALAFVLLLANNTAAALIGPPDVPPVHIAIVVIFLILASLSGLFAYWFKKAGKNAKRRRAQPSLQSL